MTRRKSQHVSSQDSGVSDMFLSQDSSETAVYSSFSSNEISEERFSSQSSFPQSQSVPDTVLSKLPGDLGCDETAPTSSVPEIAATEVATATEVPPCMHQSNASNDPSISCQSSSGICMAAIAPHISKDLADL